MELSVTPLRQLMIEEMQIRNLAPHTQASYVQQISQFARHFGKSPELLGPAEIRAYQLHLARDRQLTASSILVAVAAIRFLYTIVLKRGWNPEEIIPTCRKPQTLPIVMSPDEVSQFLGAVDGLNHRVILTVCYAAGLRISEAVHLKATASIASAWLSASRRAKAANVLHHISGLGLNRSDLVAKLQQRSRIQRI
jgi:integrase/recombinase XerD